MIGVVKTPDTMEKLRILSADSQYDLACACGSRDIKGRTRSQHGGWIYPVTLPSGGRDNLLKTLVSNSCRNDCKYCPLRAQNDVQRCSLNSDEIVKVFLDYFNRREVFGLFLTSAVVGSADETMEKLIAPARILRKKYKCKAYIHLKVIPGAGKAAIKEAVSLADTVSVNIEVPGEEYLKKLSTGKDFLNDVIEPMKYISQLTAGDDKYERCCQTTQFIVGAAGEKDAEIVKYTAALYQRLRLSRVYFSAYQAQLGSGDLSQTAKSAGNDILTREHRLYQADFLLRKYKFSESDIIFDFDGQLSLQKDPKQVWADAHPEFFPVRINFAARSELLKVPGLGPTTVDNIINRRKTGRINWLGDIGIGKRLLKADKYLVYN